MDNMPQIEIEFIGEESEEILKCLNTLFKTPAGTVALDRNFGLDISFLDMPVKVIENLLALELINKVRVYEPRVKVKTVAIYDIDAKGRVKAKVVVESV